MSASEERAVNSIRTRFLYLLFGTGALICGERGNKHTCSQNTSEQIAAGEENQKNLYLVEGQGSIWIIKRAKCEVLGHQLDLKKNQWAKNFRSSRIFALSQSISTKYYLSRVKKQLYNEKKRKEKKRKTLPKLNDQN